MAAAPMASAQNISSAVHLRTRRRSSGYLRLRTAFDNTRSVECFNSRSLKPHCRDYRPYLHDLAANIKLSEQSNGFQITLLGTLTVLSHPNNTIIHCDVAGKTYCEMGIRNINICR